jgi:hypothetical protein
MIGRTALLALTLTGCLSAEEAFTEGRIEDLCDDTVPVCQLRADCVLDVDEFSRGTFPGAWRGVVRTDVDDAQLRVRLLLNERVYPGTELLVQVWTPGCADRERGHLVDEDLFRRAGGDGVLEFVLPAGARGDHMVEVFSDMAATWTLVVDPISPE